MKNNKIFFLILALSVGCSKSKDYPTLLGQLEKNAGADEKLLQRQLAAIPADKCMKDIFSVDMLKAEVKELEKKYSSGTKVTGTWKHLNLADLPIPQANFLKTYGSSIGDLTNPKAFDYSSCKDVPCIFNKIYGKENIAAGYVHYIWYLRMGNLLGAGNKVYSWEGRVETSKVAVYNGKAFPVSAYLYREGEIYAFWRLLHMMKTPHTALTNLKEIHRVPQGESFDFEVEERKALKAENDLLRSQGKPTKPIPLGSTCGLAWSSGYVILQDLCLTVNQEDWEGGNFYQSVLHELTHQVDYLQSGKNTGASRSSSQDYLDLSKFQLTEYKNEKNETVRQWAALPGQKLVTNYAGTSPAENFAETIAYFRVDGSMTKTKITDDHWAFTSKNYFFNKDFEKSTLINGWFSSQSSLLSQLAFKAVGDCSSKTSAATVSTYFKKTDFTTSVLPSMLNCLGSKAAEISSEVSSKVKVTDPDGCEILTSYNSKNLWEPGLKPVLADLMSKYLKELQKDNTYFARIQGFIDTIPDRAMANEAYLGCPKQDDEEDCYGQNVIRLSLEKLAPLNLPQSHAEDLADLYLAAHEFGDTKSYLTSYYRAFVSSHLEQIRQEADDSFAKCLAVPLSDEASPSGKYVSFGEGYLASSIYNCLNSDFPDTAKAIVRNLAVGEMKVQHPKEEALLYDEVVPELQKSLVSIYQKNKAKEAKAITEYIVSDEGKIRKQLLSNFDWVKDVLNTDTIMKDCRSVAMSKIDFPLAYQVKGDVFGKLVQDSCTDIYKSSEYNNWLESSKSVFSDKSVDGLELKITDMATEKAKACVVQYPIDTNLNRIKFKAEREACLIGEWPGIEAKALKEFESDPLVIKFSIDVAAVKTQLDVNRRRLQLRVIKANF